MILESTGERLPKRPRTEDAISPSVDRSHLSHHPLMQRNHNSTDEPLAKRFAAVRLNEHRPPPPPPPE